MDLMQSHGLDRWIKFTPTIFYFCILVQKTKVGIWDF